MNTEAIQKVTYSGVIDMMVAVLCYLIGVGALFWLFLASVGWVPYGFMQSADGGLSTALAINAALVFLFGLQHTVMSRKPFKAWLTQYVPAHLERAVFVLASGLAMAVLLIAWQQLPGVIWSMDDVASRLLIQIMAVFGMIYVVAASFATNHFELFGLRQAWLNLMGKDYTPVPFRREWFYSYSRHPIMFGLLFVFWCTPDMSVTRFSLAVLLTTYLLAGVQFEEKKLIVEFGKLYENYRKDVGMFITLRKKLK